jgi:hypothetical protein
MSDIPRFLEKTNINLLWEVLMDEININGNNSELMHNIKAMFTNNANHFITKDNNSIKLVELNKHFLRQIISSVNKLVFDSQIKKITITNEVINEPYKIEDIHLSRQHEFESQVINKRNELEQFMTPQKPKELDFSDKKKDGKITEMDSLLAEKLAERNADCNTIYNATKPESWLTPAETSIKQDKMQSTIINNNNNNNQLNQKLDKKISWLNDDVNNDAINIEDISLNIFNKLKKKDVEPIKYEEQQSIQLPDSKQEVIYKQIIPIIQHSPILPNNEIKNEIKEMNIKINLLVDMMTKLQESLHNLR